MTWPLASFVLLFLALGASFAWYERSRPSARVVALVATLGALAALGRVAFAPLPNVKPTTDIVLLSGYVLGGAPGFAVGAVSALASNVVFGQGPWTPWQMAGWGLCGVMGAALAVLAGRRGRERTLGRWSLALACAVAGGVFGAIMDFSLWTTYSGSHTLGQYGAISASSLPFNVAHVVGNALFCLAFGPVLVRAVRRAQTRGTIEWRPVVAVGLGALALLGGASAGAAPAQARSPVGYLYASHNRDGGWGGANDQRSASLYTAWAAIGLAAAHQRCPHGTVRYLAITASRMHDAGDLERTVLGLRACGARARDSHGRRLTTVLRHRQRRDGSVEALTNRTSFLIFALRAVGASPRSRVVRRAGAFVARQQNRDGGFSYARRGAPSGIDDTAAALQALVASGRGRSRAVRRAAGYLRRQQNADGGFPLSPRQGSNAQSTAWAIQGLVAAHARLTRVRRHGSRTPVAYLRSLTTVFGSVRYSRTSAATPVWVTGQAITGLARRPFPNVVKR